MKGGSQMTNLMNFKLRGNKFSGMIFHVYRHQLEPSYIIANRHNKKKRRFVQIAKAASRML
jgi:hypothetical protein